MTKEYRKGLMVGLLIYFIGTIATVIGHVIIGRGYVHAPPASFFIFVLTLIVGLVRLVLNLVKVFLIEIISGRDKLKGEMLVHGFIITLVFIFILWLNLR